MGGAVIIFAKLLATRPIYEDENDARQACKVGNDAMSKGYVSLIVNNVNST